MMPETTCTALADAAPVDRIQRWSTILLLAVAAVLLLSAARVAQLKLWPDPRLEAAAGGRQSTAREMSQRGEILDRRGRVLAASLVGYRLFVDPALIYDRGWEKIRKGQKADPDSPAVADPFRDAARAIASMTGDSPEVIETALRTNADRRYLVLDKHLEEWQVEGLKTLALPGVGVEATQVREYPMGSLACGLVGKVGFDQQGQSGVELRAERELRSTDGAMTFLRDVHRSPLHIERDGFKPGLDGGDVRLTIDAVIQELAEARLQEAVTQYNAGGGRLVVMDVDTGDILAMCDILRSRKGWKEITTDPARAIDPALGRNRCVTDPYEPGSTFKPFVWAWATKLGVFKPESIVNLPAGGPHVTSFGRAIRDVKYYGPKPWRFVLVKSLNAGMAIAAERMKQKDMQACLAAFGFGAETRCGIPGESAGLVTGPKKWSAYTQTSVCMGHEVGVTPVQMVRAFGAFCRDGSVAPIHITMNRDGTPREVGRTPVVPEAIALTTREAMEGVMKEGTGFKAQSTLYRMFGKSGTAQLPKPGGHGYWEDRYVSSFIAGAPFEHPRVVVLCVLDDPDRKLGHYGGSIAGPVVRDVVDRTLQYLGVPPDQDQSREAEIRSLAKAPDRH